jgi:hypothetical protein
MLMRQSPLVDIHSLLVVAPFHGILNEVSDVILSEWIETYSWKLCNKYGSFSLYVKYQNIHHVGFPYNYAHIHVSI